MLGQHNGLYQSVQDKTAFEESLAKNVEESYSRLVEFLTTDLDTDFKYVVFFNNNLKLWDVEFSSMPKDKNVDMFPNEKNDILRSDLFKKAISHAYGILMRAKGLLDSTVMQHIEEGKMLKVSEVKLEAILDCLNDKLLIDNFKARKYAR